MEDHSNQHPGLFSRLSKALEEDENRDQGITFNYKLAFHPKHQTLMLWVYHEESLITRFEHFGIHALGLHRQDIPQSELDPDHRRLAQDLLRFATLNASEGYFVVPKKHIAFFIGKLSRFHQVRFFGSEEPVHFSILPLVPLVHLNEENPAQVDLTASFQNSETGEEWPFTQVKVLSGRRPWVLHQNIFYPVKSSLITPLLEDFSQEGFLTLRGREAADFIEEYLPTLVKKPEVILPEGFVPPQIQDLSPQESYQIVEDPLQDKLILTIRFFYGSYSVPPHQDKDDVLISQSNEGKTILIRRDLAYENSILQKYYKEGFHRVGPDRFETGGEKALGFASDLLPQLKEKSEIAGEEGLSHFKMLGSLSRARLKARVLHSGMNWLEMSVGFEVSNFKVSYEQVRSLIAQGQSYLKIPGQGFLKIDRESLAEFEETLSELESEISPEGTLKVSSYHTTYLDEHLAIDWDEYRDFAEIIKSLKNVQGIPSKPLPESLKSILREYQHHGYDWLNFLHDHRLQGILADDMGLGKTLQALTYLKERQERSGSAPNLVLAPTSVVLNWAAEAQKFTPELKVLLLFGPERKKLFEEIDQADLVLTSYALFRRDIEVLVKHSFRSVILDEAQNIKNYRSKTAQLVKDLNAEQRWALTGTPLENRLSELWSIFDFLMPGFLGSYLHFKRKYQQPIEVEQSEEHLERLRKRIYPFILRRVKSEVAKELPPKTEVTHFCEMTPEQQKLYHEVLVTSRRQILTEVEKKGIERSHVSILTALLRLRQICCHPQLVPSLTQDQKIESGKMEAFKDLVQEVISEGHRILVFSQFVEMLALHRQWLEEQGIAFEYLDGRTRKREEKIQRFNKDLNIPIFLVSLRAGGTGLNLTGADYVIHYDPWWNPAVQDQATDRVHRIGQKKKVFSYKMITKNSVEEKILALQERKRGLAKGLLTTDSGLGKRLSVEDLEYLFS